jgi:hypothetical protein
MQIWYTSLTMDGSGPIREIKLKNKFFPIIVGLILIQQIIYPHKSWAILLVGFGGALIISFLWANSLKKGLNFSREMRYGWAKVGDQLRENFRLSNDSRFPALWVTILDYSNFPGYQVNTARYVESKSVKRWIKGSVCYSRGYYNFGPTELETGDPFGIFTAHVNYPEMRSMLVTPPVIPLPAIEIATGNRIGEGSARAYAPEQTVTAASVREYIPFLTRRPAATGGSFSTWIMMYRLEKASQRLKNMPSFWLPQLLTRGYKVVAPLALSLRAMNISGFHLNTAAVSAGKSFIPWQLSNEGKHH